MLRNAIHSQKMTVCKMQPDLRFEARQCVARAQALVEKGDDLSLRYACLELRFAIEYVTYDQLRAYLDEVPNDALKKWTPRQVIGEMLEVDPRADKSVTIAFGIQDEQGTPAKEMKTLGEDRRFSMRWANANHNALGSFLHVPTLHQIENGEFPSASKIAERAGKIASELAHISASPLFRTNMGEFFDFECECGTKVKRRSGTFTKESGIVCSNSKCRAIWVVVEDQGDEFKVVMRKVSYPCPCGVQHYFGAHLLKHNQALRCPNCGRRAHVAQTFEIRAEAADDAV